MLVELDGTPGDGAAADIRAGLPIVTLTGRWGTLGLAASDGAPVACAPGAYRMRVRLAVLSGRIDAVALILKAGTGEWAQDLAPEGPGRWAGDITTTALATPVALRLEGPGAAFYFAGADLNDGTAFEPPPPRVKAGLITIGRAMFRALPARWRARVLKAGAPARLLQATRKAVLAQAPPPDQEAGTGRLIRDAAAADDRYRADYEARLALARGVRDPAYVDATDEPAANPAPRAKLIAFHLPQYHPIAENDAWWGKGFTEWTNVTKAAPQFAGHYQPRLPGELGFYDLRLPTALRAQADLAQSYGIGAFAFHYYWFAGKRVLQTPLDLYRADPGIALPYCLCWANENWTRRWDGDDSQILLRQSHSREDHGRVFDDMARYLEDPRYLRVEERPVVVVYRPAIIDDVRAMTDIWREKARLRGWKDLFLIATNAFNLERAEPLGFDALCQFPPHGFQADRIEHRLDKLNVGFGGTVFDYAAVAEAQIAGLRAQTQAGLLPGVMPGWDNEARRPGAGVVYHGASPPVYEAWLRAAIDQVIRAQPPERRLVFINAWNEWAEGAHLEPDRRFGRAFLAATARALT